MTLFEYIESKDSKNLDFGKRDSRGSKDFGDFDSKYDFLGQSYASLYPNLHKYPATMLPQIGLELLKDFKAKKGALLDPYCGSGSSFISALEYGINDFTGFDLNPLAIMISKAKLSFIESREILDSSNSILNALQSLDSINLYCENQNNCKNENLDSTSPLKNITNLNFWLPQDAQKLLVNIFDLIKVLKNENVKNLFMLAFSQTLRESSYTRNGEFKLFRMKNYENFKPNVCEIFVKYLDSIIKNYLCFYQKKLKDIHFHLYNESFTNKIFENTGKKFDIVLTSPPYGDSKTTVAYGQFSTFINEWLGFKDARRLDSKLLGGKIARDIYEKGAIKKRIFEIAKISKRRALEISSFYFDLESSIKNVADSIKHEGLVFYIVGNRRVKNIELSTDKFIAKSFVQHGFRHLATIKRKISNKAMPLKNSPTNKAGVLAMTMNDEYIVVCKRA